MQRQGEEEFNKELVAGWVPGVSEVFLGFVFVVGRLEPRRWV